MALGCPHSLRLPPALRQDLPHAARASELVEALELQTLRQKWQIFESSCLKNQGARQGHYG